MYELYPLHSFWPHFAALQPPLYQYFFINHQIFTISYLALVQMGQRVFRLGFKKDSNCFCSFLNPNLTFSLCSFFIRRSSSWWPTKSLNRAFIAAEKIQYIYHEKDHFSLYKSSWSVFDRPIRENGRLWWTCDEKISVPHGRNKRFNLGWSDQWNKRLFPSLLA